MQRLHAQYGKYMRNLEKDKLLQAGLERAENLQLVKRGCPLLSFCLPVVYSRSSEQSRALHVGKSYYGI